MVAARRRRAAAGRAGPRRCGRSRGGSARRRGWGRAGEGGAYVVARELERLGVAAEAVDLGEGDDARGAGRGARRRGGARGSAASRPPRRRRRGGRASMPPAPATMVRTKRLVAGDVDDAGVQTTAELPSGEAELDGDAAAFLFGEAVGVDAGEGADEGGLAVVDVTGGADDEGAVWPGHEVASVSASWVRLGGDDGHEGRRLAPTAHAAGAWRWLSREAAARRPGSGARGRAPARSAERSGGSDRRGRSSPTTRRSCACKEMTSAVWC
jgi:hypothetical protein